MNHQEVTSNPILLVDDEADALSLLQSFLCHDGFRNVVTFDDSPRALEYFKNEDVALAVIDLRMPKLHGSDLLEAFSELKPAVPVIVVTAESDVNTAIDCMKTGAADYLTKPISISRFITSVHRALELRRLDEEISLLENSSDNDISARAPHIPSIITRDKEMLTLLSYAEVVSKSRQPVLITGETGVGKELVARAVHTLSGLKGDFISINIAGLDDQMFSDTLFGHRRGAFTGALNDRDGLIMKAANGTMFLDEIGDLNELSQIKLLRLLQENEYYQLGSDTPLKSTARLVVATNRNLWKCMNDGKFRKDLYYRLCTHQVAIPPLRKRPDDIPLLLEHFIRQSAKTLGKGKLTYRKELVDFLVTYEFPGNIRELQSIVHDFVSRTTTSKLSTALLKKVMTREQEPATSMLEHEYPATSPDFNGITFSSFPTLKHAETILIEKALEIARNNQGTAARMLGITRQALNNRLRREKERK
ncbi:MAG: sigma-54 dependent transcriptional regulator [Desulfobacteraceae bacterium]|nr:sigma-54 dependent transcriptional regulator [Desulfobacteraceae bacterium]